MSVMKVPHCHWIGRTKQKPAHQPVPTLRRRPVTMMTLDAHFIAMQRKGIDLNQDACRAARADGLDTPMLPSGSNSWHGIQAHHLLPD
jgi:hypothetical protein